MSLNHWYDYVITTMFIYVTNIEIQLEKVTDISYFNNTITEKSMDFQTLWLFEILV